MYGEEQKYMHAGILVEKREGHEQLNAPRLRWDDNIQIRSPFKGLG
jgi:hypothetical protein